MIRLKVIKIHKNRQHLTTNSYNEISKTEPPVSSSPLHILETKLSNAKIPRNLIQLQPPLPPPSSIRPMKNIQCPLERNGATPRSVGGQKTVVRARGRRHEKKKGGLVERGRGISRPRLGWAN